MNGCVSPEGHEWSDRPELGPPEPLAWQGKQAVWGDPDRRVYVEPKEPGPFPTITQDDVSSTFVWCTRWGCKEIGYVLAQNVSQEESA